MAVSPQAPAAGGEADPKEDKAASADAPTKRGQYPWQGVHTNSQNKLHLQVRKDRNPLMVLFENGKHILCCRIDRCGAIAL